MTDTLLVLCIVHTEISQYLQVREALTLFSANSELAGARRICIQNCIIRMPSTPMPASAADFRRRFSRLFDTIRAIELPPEEPLSTSSHYFYDLTLPLFPNLRVLCAPGLSNLRILRLLENLVELDISSNYFSYVDERRVTDISAMQHLPSLKDLNLRLRDVQNVSPLLAIRTLERLSLVVFDNVDETVEVLTRMTNLRYLAIGGRGMRDGTLLGRLGSLVSLEITDANMGEIDFVTSLRFLRCIALRRCPVTHIAALSNIRSLEEVDLAETSVHDISPLSSLKNLSKLVLAYTFVVDLSPLCGMDKLKYLNIDFTHVSDLDPLGLLPNLSTLSANGTEIAYVTALRGCNVLQHLYISETRVRFLNPLLELPRLVTLKASHTIVYDLSSLSGMKTLKVLELAHTAIEDISAISKSTRLETLNLSGTTVMNMEPLSNLTNLQCLMISCKNASNLNFFGGLTRLRKLHIEVTSLNSQKIGFWEPVMRLPNLEFLYLLGSRDIYIDNLQKWASEGNVEFLSWRKDGDY